MSFEDAARVADAIGSHKAMGGVAVAVPIGTIGIASPGQARGRLLLRRDDGAKEGKGLDRAVVICHDI